MHCLFRAHNSPGSALHDDDEDEQAGQGIILCPAHYNDLCDRPMSVVI